MLLVLLLVLLLLLLLLLCLLRLFNVCRCSWRCFKLVVTISLAVSMVRRTNSHSDDNASNRNLFKTCAASNNRREAPVSHLLEKLEKLEN